MIFPVFANFVHFLGLTYRKRGPYDLCAGNISEVRSSQGAQELLSSSSFGRVAIPPPSPANLLVAELTLMEASRKAFLQTHP